MSKPASNDKTNDMSANQPAMPQISPADAFTAALDAISPNGNNTLGHSRLATPKSPTENPEDAPTGPKAHAAPKNPNAKARQHSPTKNSPVPRGPKAWVDAQESKNKGRPQQPARAQANKNPANAKSPSKYSGQGRESNSPTFSRPGWGRGRPAKGVQYGPPLGRGRNPVAGPTPINPSLRKPPSKHIDSRASQGSPVEQGSSIEPPRSIASPQAVRMQPAGTSLNNELSFDAALIPQTGLPGPSGASAQPEIEPSVESDSPSQRIHHQGPSQMEKPANSIPSYRVDSEQQADSLAKKASKLTATPNAPSNLRTGELRYTGSWADDDPNAEVENTSPSSDNQMSSQLEETKSPENGQMMLKAYSQIEELLAKQTKLEQAVTALEAKNQELRTDNGQLQAEVAKAGSSLTESQYKYIRVEKELVQYKRSLAETEAALKKRNLADKEKEDQIEHFLVQVEAKETEVQTLTRELEKARKDLASREKDHRNDLNRVNDICGTLREFTVKSDEDLSQKFDAILEEINLLHERELAAKKLKNADELTIEKMVVEAERAQKAAQDKLKDAQDIVDKLRADNETLNTEYQAIFAKNVTLEQQHQEQLEEAGAYKILLQDLSDLMPDMTPPGAEPEYDEPAGDHQVYIDERLKKEFKDLIDENRILKNDLKLAQDQLQRNFQEDLEPPATPLSEHLPDREDDTSSGHDSDSQSSASVGDSVDNSVTRHTLHIHAARPKPPMVSTGAQTDGDAVAQVATETAIDVEPELSTGIVIPGLSILLTQSRLLFLMFVIPLLSWVYSECQWVAARQERAHWVAANYDTLAYRDRQVYGYAIPRDRAVEFMAHKLIDFLGFAP